MRSSLRKFLQSEREGSYALGHASVLVRLSGKLVLFDPVWDFSPYGENWCFWPEQVNADEILERVDAVVISHCHSDHLCPPVLKRYGRKVFILGGRPNIRAALEKCGVEIVEQSALHWQELIPGISILWAPHPTNQIDSLPFLRAVDTGVTISLGSDCFLDRATLERLKPLVPRLDVAFCPFSFIFWWPFLQVGISESWRNKEIKRVVNQVADQARLFCEVLQPKLAIGTGADLYYAGGRRHILNRHLLVQGPPMPLQRFTAGDYVLLEKDGKPYYRFHGALDGDTFPEPSAHPLNLATALITPKTADLKRLAERLAGAPKQREIAELIVNEIVFDLRTGEVFHRKGGNPASYYRFEVDAPVYEQWLRGKIRFEEVLGTRRFQFSRNPDTWVPALFTLCNDFL